MLNITWKVKYKGITEVFTCHILNHAQYMFAVYWLTHLISHELIHIMFGINFRGLLYWRRKGVVNAGGSTAVWQLRRFRRRQKCWMNPLTTQMKRGQCHSWSLPVRLKQRKTAGSRFWETHSNINLGRKDQQRKKEEKTIIALRTLMPVEVSRGNVGVWHTAQEQILWVHKG